MPEHYALRRSLEAQTEPLTKEQAAEIYLSQRRRPGAQLDGDLESGFHFWVFDGDGMRLGRYHVMPAGPE